MSTKRTKKGFTLVEMSIAMTVTAVLLSMIMSLLVVVIKNVEKNQHDGDVNSEISVCTMKINNWFSEFADYSAFSSLYTFAVFNGEDELNDKTYGQMLSVYEVDNSDDGRKDHSLASIYFDNDNKMLYCSNKSSVLKLEHFDKILFATFGDKVKVKLFYDSMENPMIMLLVPGDVT